MDVLKRGAGPQKPPNHAAKSKEFLGGAKRAAQNADCGGAATCAMRGHRALRRAGTIRENQTVQPGRGGINLPENVFAPRGHQAPKGQFASITGRVRRGINHPDKVKRLPGLQLGRKEFSALRRETGPTAMRRRRQPEKQSGYFLSPAPPPCAPAAAAIWAFCAPPPTPPACQSPSQIIRWQESRMIRPPKSQRRLRGICRSLNAA